jgi:hypothetical protein
MHQITSNKTTKNQNEKLQNTVDRQIHAWVLPDPWHGLGETHAWVSPDPRETQAWVSPDPDPPKNQDDSLQNSLEN